MILSAAYGPRYKRLSSLRRLIMAHKQAEAAAPAVKGVEPIILTGTRPVVVIGQQLVSTKLLALAQFFLTGLCDLVNGDETPIVHDVHVLSFDVTSMPKAGHNGKPALSMWYPDTHTICMYLRNVLADVERVMRSKKNCCSANMLIWQTMLHCLLHEIRHSQAMLAGEGEFTIDELEADADEWAQDMLPLIARTVDIEPPTLAEMPWLGAQVMGIMVKTAKQDPKSYWLTRQREMNDRKLLYMSPKGQKTLERLFDYFRARGITAGDSEDIWCQQLDAVSLVSTNLGSVTGGTVQSTGPAPPPPCACPKPPTAPPPPQFEHAPCTTEQAPAPPGPLVKPKKDKMHWTTKAFLASIGALDENGNEIEFTREQPQDDCPDDDECPFHDDSEIDYVFPDTPDETEAAPAAPQSSTTYQQRPNPTVPANGITAAQAIPIMHNVYIGCWHHIFTKCGQLTGQDQAFSNPGAVLEKISFAHIPQFASLVTHMDCSVTGQNGAAKFASQVPVCNGEIWGHVAAKNQMPLYTLYFNINGQSVRRLLIPANPAKANKMGQGARAGEKHLLVIDADADSGPVGVVTNGAFRSFK
jgi:hypothetical protein